MGVASFGSHNRLEDATEQACFAQCYYPSEVPFMDEFMIWHKIIKPLSRAVLIIQGAATFADMPLLIMHPSLPA